MSNYKRRTRECNFEEIHPILQEAMRAYFVQHELPDIESQIVSCCETVAELEKTSALETMLKEDTDLVYYLATFLTSDWLVWARSGNTTKTTVAAARLKDIHVRPYAAFRQKDFGLEIDGYVDGSFSKIQGHITLGPEPAAEAFCDTVEKAVRVANPPRRLIDLFGKIPH